MTTSSPAAALVTDAAQTSQTQTEKGPKYPEGERYFKSGDLVSEVYQDV